MISEILPSSYRKPTPEQSEQEPTLYDKESFQRTGRITPTMLARASQCQLRATWLARGEKGVNPSPFTEAVMKDGKEYESEMLQDDGRKIWIRALNNALNLNLPEDMPRRDSNALNIGPSEEPKDFVDRAKNELHAALQMDHSAPFFLHEPRLASTEETALLQGLPDLMIWSGKEWILVDLKCSEEAKRTHGIQVAAYARMLRAMFPDMNNIHPTGVIVHCAPGYRYTAASIRDQKNLTLSHSQATPFPLESLARPVAEAVTALSTPDDTILARALAAAVFSAACVECEFRFRCYPRFIQQRHISLVPLQKAELAAVMTSDIHTVDDLIAAIDNSSSPAYTSLLELKDGSPLQLRYLREKAEKILEKGLYSKWRAAPEDLENPLFFASVEDQSAFSTPLEELNVKPTSLIVYTEHERRQAWAQIYAAGKNLKGIPTHVLSESVQQCVHGPLPSITLHPLAEMLDKLKNYAALESYYPEASTNKMLAVEKNTQDSTTPQERINDLEIVLGFLNSASIPFSL